MCLWLDPIPLKICSNQFSIFVCANLNFWRNENVSHFLLYHRRGNTWPPSLWYPWNPNRAKKPHQRSFCDRTMKAVVLLSTLRNGIKKEEWGEECRKRGKIEPSNLPEISSLIALQSAAAAAASSCTSRAVCSIRVTKNVPHIKLFCWLAAGMHHTMKKGGGGGWWGSWQDLRRKPI